MKSLRTQAIVLKRTDYGEADRILQLLTNNGRENVIARGVRREKSRLAGGIELFAVSDVVITRGRGELGIVTSARLVVFFRRILEDYETLQFAYEAVKQVARDSEGIDEPEWFTVLYEVLYYLDGRTVPLGLIETWFYLRYADLLGHGLNTRQDVDGNRLEEGQSYRYGSMEQGFRAIGGGDVTGQHIKLLRLAGVKPLRVLAQIGGLEPILSVCLVTARTHAGV